MYLKFLLLITVLLLQNFNVITQNTKTQYDDILNLIFNTNVTQIPTQNERPDLDNNFTSILNLPTEKPINNLPVNKNPVNQNTVTEPTVPKDNHKYCGENKICVPFFLCKNGTETLNHYGEYLIDIRFDDGKSCSQYLETCCHINDITSDKDFIVPKPTTDTSKQSCGNRNIDGIGFRITGAVEGETEYAEFPWMIAVLTEEVVDDETLAIYKCGGSLIHPSVVMTAAHCVCNHRVTDLVLRAGEWDAQTKDEIFMEQNRKVSNLVMHENFNPRNVHYDIALLFTVKPFELGVDVNTVCLPPPNMIFDNNRCIATGWGKDVFGKEGKYQVIMKKLELPIVEFGVCQQKLRETRLGLFFKLHESFICAGGEIGKDTCKGDGGGPLVCPIPGKLSRYYQAGIVAWGIGCGSATPGVYGNVSYLRRWIDTIFAEKNLETSYYTLS